MKLYSFTPAANALRVEMFLREKNIDIETIQVNVSEDEIFKEPYNSMNPFNCVPFLELEDGTIISETISICKYRYRSSILYDFLLIFNLCNIQLTWIHNWNCFRQF